MDMSLSRLWERVKDREAWSAAVYDVAKNRTCLNNWTTGNYTLGSVELVNVKIKELAWWQKLKGCVGRWCSVDLDSTAKATWCSKLSGGKVRCKQRKNAQRHKAGAETQAETDGMTEVERRDVTSPWRRTNSYLLPVPGIQVPPLPKKSNLPHTPSFCHSAGFQLTSVFRAFPSVWNDRRGKRFQCDTPWLSLPSKVRLPTGTSLPISLSCPSSQQTD